MVTLIPLDEASEESYRYYLDPAIKRDPTAASHVLTRAMQSYQSASLSAAIDSMAVNDDYVDEFHPVQPAR